jgi:hypothetical protein
LLHVLRFVLSVQGPWLNFFETILLVMIGNAFFMACVVYLPLNIGRLSLTALRHICQSLSPDQQMLLQQLLSRHMQWPVLKQVASILLSTLLGNPGEAAAATAAAAAAANATIIDVAVNAANGTATVTAGAALMNAAAGAVASAAAAIAAAATGALSAAAALSNITATTVSTAPNSTAAAGIAGAFSFTNASDGVPTAAAADPGMALYPALDSEPLPLMALSFDQVFRELQAQLELPARADFLALSLGHMLLAVLLVLGLWLYTSVRLWKAASSRVRGPGGRPLLQVGHQWGHVRVGRGGGLLVLPMTALTAGQDLADV